MVLMESDRGALSIDDILNSTRELGIENGDTVMVHSRLFTIGRIPKSIDKKVLLNGFLKALNSVVGDEGTLIFPTFTLSFCKTGHFDLFNTPSEMGVLSEDARVDESYTRTVNPIYSVVVKGKDKDKFLSQSPSTCFGKDSIFDLIHKAGNVKFLTIGVSNPCEAISLVHYVEEELKVPYRYFKEFKGNVVTGSEQFEQTVSFYVRDIERNVEFDFDKCYELTKKHNIYSTHTLGNNFMTVVREEEFYEAVKEELGEDQYVFVSFNNN